MTPDGRSAPEAASTARLVQEFDHWDPELAEDPFPVYDGLREQCPVAHSDAYGGFFVLSRYEDIEAAARDHETFSSRSISVPDPGVMPSSPPLDLDPPRHTAFRRVLLPYFSPGRTQKLEPISRAVAAGLIETFAEQGHCDVAQDFAKHVPIAVLSHILGVEPRHEALFTNWTDLIVSGGPDPQVSATANVEIRDYFARLIEERRRRPKDDLATFLVSAGVEGEPISTVDQLGVASLLLVAGIDTTWCMLGTRLVVASPAPRSSGAPDRRPGPLAERRRGAAAALRPGVGRTDRDQGRLDRRPDHPRRRARAASLPRR